MVKEENKTIAKDLIKDIFAFLVSCVMTVIVISLFKGLTANAEESGVYQYSLKYETYGYYWNTSQDIVIASDTPVVGYYYDGFNDGKPEVNFFTYAEHYDLLNQVNLPCSGTYLNTEVGTEKINSGEVTTFTIPTVPTARINELRGGTGKTLDETAVFETTIPIFDSLESVKKYIAEGDTGGQINKPGIDWTIPHDFSTDKYSYDIPVPELSNVTHEGFVLSNWTSDYFVDVIVESEFNGLEIKSDINNLSATKYYLEYDADWLFDSHYYNFTLSDVAVSQENINIADSFGVDIMGDLISDFVDWSVNYPKLSSLPSYSFFRYSPGIEVEYKSYHLYDSTGASSDLSQLNQSGQACTVYYVRYYTKDMKCSQWVKYTVRPAYQIGTYEKNGVLNVGSVDVDLDGNVSVDENYQGSIDSSGNVSYDVPALNMNKIDLNNSMNDFWSILKSMYYGMDSFPGIVRELFGFLPSWVTTFMGLSIFAVILMRFLGR